MLISQEREEYKKGKKHHGRSMNHRDQAKKQEPNKRRQAIQSNLSPDSDQFERSRNSEWIGANN
jgi:hypothetical protein